jgi:short-subunit dehydrogenase
MGAYAASKHALEGMSESLRREMMLYGIDVVIVAPGPIATPIWDKAEQVDVSRYQNTDFFEAGKKVQKYAVKNGRNGLPAERVGVVIFQALTTASPRVRYTVTPNPFLTWVMSIMPRRYVDNLMAKNLGLLKKA